MDIKQVLMSKALFDNYRRPILIFSSILLLFIFLSFSSLGEQAMFSLFKRYDVELSPVVKGRITDGGKAVSGMEVVRELSYSGYDNGKLIIDYALTDINGEFSFDELIVKSKSPGDIFGQDAPVKQYIFFHKDIDESTDENNEHWLWRVSKHWTSVPFLNNYLNQLNTDLQNKELHYEFDLTEYGLRADQMVISTCYWQGNKISAYYGDDLEEVTSFDDLED
ncbi:hypothetical protein Q4591_17100 [Shewanella sp. 3_MG-2023]|uniref:DUF6795 domain-containing protein n=1 Tax=Shewanella sp. 3_MG-2023 TaxID=3062635 RepID=UPI0026E166A2|nr:DUF6795 domain-containing protein [Shewanella sp. 3_MG-2023]MDO6777063.1 hypothetical protein [Shewanella sp. 3_MG-2023]